MSIGWHVDLGCWITVISPWYLELPGAETVCFKMSNMVYIVNKRKNQCGFFSYPFSLSVEGSIFVLLSWIFLSLTVILRPVLQVDEKYTNVLNKPERGFLPNIKARRGQAELPSGLFWTQYWTPRGEKTIVAINAANSCNNREYCLRLSMFYYEKREKKCMMWT